jgi:DNA repair photolyase
MLDAGRRLLEARINMLNKQSGNMYGFITHTWNTIKGKCSHDCIYCYMKRFELKEVRFDEKELKTNLGENNFIFVGSSNDMFAENIPDDWILKTLNICEKFNKNKYLFQTKNPKRYLKFSDYTIISNSILCCTLETNRYYKISNAPFTKERAWWMKSLGFENMMITIEPILDFDLDDFIKIITKIKPIQVNIGADSKKHNLPEPDQEKIKELIIGLQENGIKVFIKENLKRLAPYFL